MYGVEPPIALRISDEVLTDQNKLKILCKSNEGTLVEKLSAQLHIISCDSKILFLEPRVIQRAGLGIIMKLILKTGLLETIQ